MELIQGVIQCCPVALWWFSALLTPTLVALIPMNSAQKSGRS